MACCGQRIPACACRVLLTFFGLVVPGILPLSAYHTQNVFVVVVDGLRNTEAFEDPQHLYIPYLWNGLRPLGTMYSDFYNLGATKSWQGSASMLTGVHHSLIWHRPPLEPTFLEYFRKQTGAPQGKTYFMSNNDGKLCDPNSEHPYYQGAGPTTWLTSGHDAALHNQVKTVMDQDHPNLLYIQYDDVDLGGHSNMWRNYTGPIARVDSMIYDLWQKIQANSSWDSSYTDTTYRNRTTMIVTCDHGRHDDAHGGFQDHGDFCHGCRHVMFLVLGPDIRVNEEVSVLGEQEDICPTVGTLLGFPTPLAQGRLLREMLVSAPREDSWGSAIPDSGAKRLTKTPGMSRNPRVAANRNGLEVVWSEQDETAHSGGDEIYYRNSPDGGISWSRRELLLPDSPKWDRTFVNAAIAGDGGAGTHLVATYIQRTQNSPAKDSTFGWGMVSLGWASSPRNDVDSLVSPELMILQNGPAIDVLGAEIEILSNRWSHELLRCYSRDGGWSWGLAGIEPEGGGDECLFPDVAIDGEGVGHGIWWEDGYRGDVLRYYHDLSGGLSFEVDLSDTEQQRGGAAIAAKGDSILVAWSDDRSGVLQVYLRASPDLGATWPAEVLPISQSTMGGWHCDLAAQGETIWVVWEDYRDGNGEIYGRVSSDGGQTWSAEIRLTKCRGFSVYPQIVAYEGTFSLVWQDDRDGNFEIYFSNLPQNGQ